MLTSRQRLIAYLESRQAATTDDISRALHFTPANIRHHLSHLVEEGIVQTVGFRPKQARGRPERLYALVRQISSHNLDGLSSALIRILSAQDKPENDSWVQDLAEELGKPVQGSESPTKRLFQVVKHLNELNYQSRWEAHSDGPRIILGHCPYAAILHKHPELCLMDRFLLEDLLKADVSQISRLEVGAKGLPQCVFRILSGK
jgi:predicted ArsR family transcriptional regulator